MATRITSYAYRADVYTPAQIIHALTGNGSRHSDPASVEADLDALAAARGIDRGDEYSFDSSQFPKVIFNL